MKGPLIFLQVLACAVAVSGCDHPAPLAVSVPTQPSAGSGDVKSAVDLRVDGPNTVAPGESAQYTATATYSDRSTRDVTSDVLWTSTNDSALSVKGGIATGHANGEADVRASLGILSNDRTVVVVPSGTFRLFASAHDEQGLWIHDVQVEVTSGPAAAMSATTNWDGATVFYGVPSDVQVRFSKDGYEPAIRNVHITSISWTVGVQLVPSSERVDIHGQYRLTISSGDCFVEGVMPEAAKTRTYSAWIWNNGLRYTVELCGANLALEWCPLCHETRGNRFNGQPEVRALRFTLIPYEAPFDWNAGIYPSVVERLPDGRLLAISGQAVVTPTSDGFEGTLDGMFAIYTQIDLTYQESPPVAACRSRSHRFVLVR